MRKVDLSPISAKDTLEQLYQVEDELGLRGKKGKLDWEKIGKLPDDQLKTFYNSLIQVVTDVRAAESQKIDVGFLLDNKAFDKLKTGN